MMTTANAVAETILQQLGRTFRVMTGARDFVASADTLRFRLPSTPHYTKDGINVVAVTLTPADTYRLTFYRVRGSKVATVAVDEDVYTESLRRVFTSRTGLETSLGTLSR